MMPTVRLDNDVFQALESIAEPFTDTPLEILDDAEASLVGGGVTAGNGGLAWGC